jgi:hypothetical protein
MTFQFTSVCRRYIFKCPIEDRQAVAARETRLVPNSIDVGVLLVERAAKCTARRLIACVSGISWRAEDQATRFAQVNNLQRNVVGGKFNQTTSSDISKRHEAPITLHQAIAHHDFGDGHHCRSVACTWMLMRHVDGIRSTDVSMDIYRIENRLESIEQYLCSANRNLELIQSNTESPAARTMSHGINIQPCPGDPGQSR